MASTSTTHIRFYEKGKPFFEFSNYYTLPKDGKFLIDGREYTSTEHYYQSMKFRYAYVTPLSLEFSEVIRGIKTPDMSRILAGQRKQGGYKWKTDLNPIIEKYSEVRFDRERWDRVKDNVMRRAVYQKFARVPLLKDLLLSTGTSYIEEDSPRDPYWGVGKDRRGENMLGIILQEVRYILSGGKLLSHSIPLPSFLKSHWVIPGVLMTSSYPNSKGGDPSAIESFEDLGINAFISLQTHFELRNKTFDRRGDSSTIGFKPYDEYIATDFSLSRSDREELVGEDESSSMRSICYTGRSKRYPSTLFFATLPIVDRKAISSDDLAEDMRNAILSLIARKMRVLVHCYGGKGRTGEMCCLIFGKLYGMTAEESMSSLQKIFDERRVDRGVAPCKIPQTSPQRNQLLRIMNTYTFFD